MKIFLQDKDKAGGGKAIFLKRLAKGIREATDAEVTHDPTEPCDVSLHSIGVGASAARKKVVRLDGVWHNTAMDWKGKNAKIIAGLRKADALVYQSNYAKAMCERYLGVFNGPTTVVMNGIDPRDFDEAPSMAKPYPVVYLSASKWRPHKRLRDTIESFLMAKVPDSHLFIAGDTSNSGLSKTEVSRYNSLSNITFLGNVSQEVLAQYLKVANGFIHLCWFDACPNSVVEAIGAGVPVVTNNVGGTRELVEPSRGFVCDIDKKYDMKPIKLYTPLPIDRGIVASAIRACVNAKGEIKNEHVHIHNIAQQYVEFFKTLV